MAIVYTYKVDGVRVVIQDDLPDVVREVDVTVTGTDGTATFQLPTTIKFGVANPDNFTPFDSLTEAQVAEWVDTSPDIEPVKAHIAFVVAKLVAESLMENKNPPWAPPAPTPPAPPVSEVIDAPVPAPGA